MEIYKRLGLNIGGVCSYRRGDVLPRFDHLIRIINFFDPHLAGIMEHFWDPKADPEDFIKLTPQRARSLFYEWLHRRLRLAEINRCQLSKKMGVSATGVYPWFAPHPQIPNVGKDVPSFMYLMKLMEILDPPLFEQVVEQLSLKEEN
jgi:hypothetical protein